METTIATLIGLTLFIFGLVQFSSLSSTVYSDPIVIQNLTSQGYTGASIYIAPIFVSTYILIILGLILLGLLRLIK